METSLVKPIDAVWRALFRGVIRKRLNEDCTRFKEKLESGALAT